MKRIPLIFMAALVPLFGSAQSIGGLHRNPLSVSIVVPENLLRAEWLSLPKQYSLWPYAPEPKIQQYGSCTGFASAYAARNIAWNFRHRLTASNEKMAFDPYFHYNLIKHINDSLCESGAVSEDGFRLLETTGAVPDGSLVEPCSYPDETLKKQAAAYRVSGVQTLYNNCDIHTVVSDTSRYYAVVHAFQAF